MTSIAAAPALATTELMVAAPVLSRIPTESRRRGAWPFAFAFAAGIGTVVWAVEPASRAHPSGPARATVLVLGALATVASLVILVRHRERRVVRAAAWPALAMFVMGGQAVAMTVAGHVAGAGVASTVTFWPSWLTAAGSGAAVAALHRIRRRLHGDDSPGPASIAFGRRRVLRDCRY